MKAKKREDKNWLSLNKNLNRHSVPLPRSSIERCMFITNISTRMIQPIPREIFGRILQAPTQTRMILLLPTKLSVSVDEKYREWRPKP